MAILVELPDSAASLLLRSQAEEIARLRAELAGRLQAPPASFWTPAGRKALSVSQKAAWARRKAADATAIASADRGGLNCFLNGNGHTA